MLLTSFIHIQIMSCTNACCGPQSTDYVDRRAGGQTPMRGREIWIQTAFLCFFYLCPGNQCPILTSWIIMPLGIISIYACHNPIWYESVPALRPSAAAPSPSPAERRPSGQLDLKELCVQKAMCGINHRTKWIRLEGTSELLGLARCPDAFYDETY